MFDRFRKKKPAKSPAEPPARSMGAVLDRFLATPLPDAIDGLTFRVSMATPEGPDSVSDFERYAARMLGEAGATGVRAIAAENPLSLIRLDTTGLFWTKFDRGELDAEQAHCVLSTEAALNRLELLSRAAGTTGASSFAANPPEHACSVMDWGIIRSVANSATQCFDKDQPENGRLSLNGATGQHGGNWDVLTRFCELCEGAVLPFRLTYRVDADMASNMMKVRFMAPAAGFFPRSRWDDDAQQWRDMTGERAQAAAAYTLRVAVLTAAMAFGTSVGVQRVVVNAHADTLDEPVLLSLEFERMAFLMHTLPAVARHDFSAEGTEWDFGHLLTLAAPNRHAFDLDSEGGLGPTNALDDGMPDLRPPLGEDTRAVPFDLVPVLRADEVRELDVLSVQDEALVEHFRAIMADSEDAPLLAIAQLEELLSSIEEKDREARRSADGDLTPLYCQGVYARYLISLAEADESQRFFRVSDVGFSARTALLQLYLELGEHDAALAQGKACVAMAPSSPSAYQELVNALVARDDYAAVVDAEKQALRLVAAPDETAYLYYRLAYAFWKTGQHDLALACYLRVPPHVPMGEMAATERAELMAEMKRTDLDGFDRDAVLRAGGVPLAPTDEAQALLAAAAIRFCDAGIPLAAAPMAGMLGALRHDDVLGALGQSLRYGA